LPGLLDELVRWKVELIITAGTDAAVIAKRATSNIPLVMLGAVVPLELGLVSSLARPGGNVTGTALAAPEMAGKRLSLIREAMPGAKRIGMLWNSATPGWA